MKKYLLGIILFIAGVALMVTGLYMQFVMIPKTALDNNQQVTESNEEETIKEESPLQDISTFDFSPITQAVITGKAAGYLTTCNNDKVVPTVVDIMSLNSLLNSIKNAKGYFVSDKALSTCSPASLVIGTLADGEITNKLLEIEPLDKNSLLISFNGTVYEFVFDSDVSSIISNL